MVSNRVGGFTFDTNLDALSTPEGWMSAVQVAWYATRTIADKWLDMEGYYLLSDATGIDDGTANSPMLIHMGDDPPWKKRVEFNGVSPLDADEFVWPPPDSEIQAARDSNIRLITTDVDTAGEDYGIAIALVLLVLHREGIVGIRPHEATPEQEWNHTTEWTAARAWFSNIYGFSWPSGNPIGAAPPW